MTATARLSMRGIRKAFGATVALDGVDLSVHAGEIHALVGENGAGKSTLMKVLSGALRPDEGSIALDGSEYRPRNTLEGRRAGVAMIYQELSLASHLTVEQNVMLGLEPSSWGIVNERETIARTREALAQLGHPTLSPTTPVRTLSIAEQQIVEIARAIAIGCRVLILDEPTSSLTQKDITELFALLRRLRELGHAIVYISHFLEEVSDIADTYTVLRDGRSVGSGLMREVSIGELIRLMIGRKVDQLYPRSPRTAGETLLVVAGLAGSPKPTEATLELRRGEILGIAGLVGAGRTELLRSIFGLAPVVRGDLRVGLYTGAASPARRWAQGVGYVSEDRSREGLALSLSITENILMNLRKDVGVFGTFSPSAHHRKAGGWITTLGVRSTGPRQAVRSLSGGNQQKVALARLLHEEVDILLLDEPTRGIDVASKSAIYALLDELATGNSAAGRPARGILMVSSYLPELLGICDRIAVMSRGRLGEARPTGEWTEHMLMLDAFGQGTAA